MSHTPGPWSFRTAPNGDNGISADGTGVFIEAFAEIRHSGENAREEALANARLIAAAPDLLGAMRFILAFYEPGQRHLDTEAWKVAEASARRAVAKAEGSAQ